MRSSSIAPFIMAATLVACDATSLTRVVPNARGVATRSAAVQSVPFTSSSYSFIITGAAPDEGCAAPEARVFLTGEGTATHLGTFTVSFSFCRRANGTLDAGRGSFIAADGNKLRFTFTGVSAFVPPSTVNFTSHALFAGGTGRFADAGGNAEISGSIDVGKGTGDGRWDGEITR